MFELYLKRKFLIDTSKRSTDILILLKIAPTSRIHNNEKVLRPVKHSLIFKK